MIETVINLAGEPEKFDAKKLNHWVQDAVGSIKIDEWSEIALEAVRDLPKETHVLKLMQSLIDALLARNTWTHYLMAGRLLAVQIRMEIFGSKKVPTVREVQKSLCDKDLMRPLQYSDYEWSVIEQTINHDLDFNAPHFALEQIRYKYSLQDFSAKLEFETQQFVYMRMAMALFEAHAETEEGVSLENEDPAQRSRLEHVVRIYRHFSTKRLSAPTPNYNNLGTYHRGYASCCLIANGDERFSLAAADHISYLMTTQSAGIGLNSMTRSIGDPVQKGRFLHRGKKPYIDVYGKNIRANLQGGRGGAGTFYANLFDPEAKMIFGLRDTRADDTKRNRDAHYAYLSNRFFLMKAAREEKVFSWNCFTAPDLHEAFYGPDIQEFARIYEKYEQDPKFVKNYYDARELYMFALQQGSMTGTIYGASIDEMNRNTPFLDPIHSSNLCVAPGTIVHTRKGPRIISTLENQKVEIWNGYEWSEVTIRKTAERAKLVRVYVNTGAVRTGDGYLDCTEAHKWYIKGQDGKEKEVRTVDLKPGDQISDYLFRDKTVQAQILDIEDLGVENATYCFTEPKRHRALFNGIMTGQCLEVSEPNYPYSGRRAMMDLYSEVEVGHAKWVSVSATGYHHTVNTLASHVVTGPNGRWVAQSVKPGYQHDHEKYGVLTVEKVISVKKEPEVALCSLAAVNVTEEITDAEYRDVMYYAYKMIDYCILENDYILPHMGVTAKARMNAGVGMMGLATHLARRKLKYTTQDGLKEIHRVFERHLYFAIEASLQISKERGLAPWIQRTKWPDGWTPLSTYRKEVDQLADFQYYYDHEEQRQRIIANGGLAHSCLINFMPGESSSKALASVNSIYGIRKKVMIKTDAGIILRWAAPYGDDPEYEYQSMWDTTLIEQNSIYAIAQKFCDQAPSADWYLDFTHTTTINSSDLFDAEVDRVKKGVKTRYYINTLMPVTDDANKISKSVHSLNDQTPTHNEELYAESVKNGFEGTPAGWVDEYERLMSKGFDSFEIMTKVKAFSGTREEFNVKTAALFDTQFGVIHDGQATSDKFADLASAGISFQEEGGDGHLDCPGCSA